jgi:tetratricopeptide (TPR) repeat protein
MGNIHEALEYYEQAELLNAENVWTLRRMAACNRMLGRTEAALEYYKRIELKKPDDLGIALNIGNCYLELNRPADALRYYFKVEFLDEKSTRAFRPIAWASFISGDYEQCQYYSDKILLDSPTASDYMNVGHLSLVRGNVQEALNYYRLSIEKGNNDVESFINNFNNDVAQLCKGGVDESLPPLIVDTLLYERQS